MYTLFNKPLGYRARSISSSVFDYTVKAQNRNLERVVNYYKNKDYAVKSDHLMVRLIHSLPSSHGIDLQRYLYMVEDLVPDLSQAFDFNSSVNFGKTQYPGTFLGEDSEETIVLHSEKFSLADIKLKWKKYEPIRFLKHPKSDLGLRMPLGEGYSDEVGPSVILINLPMLAAQYVLWKESIADEEYQETTMQFLVKHPIANSLNSYQQIVMLNILYNLFSGKEVSDVGDDHSFYLNTYYEKTVDGLTDLLHMNVQRKQSFLEFIETAELLNEKTIREVVAIPKMAWTRQVIWALVISRLNTVAFLLLWDERTDGDLNREPIKRIGRSLKQIKSDRNLDKIGSHTLSKNVRTFIDEEIKSYF